MTWVVIAASAFALWCSVVMLVLGLCRSAARGDEAVARDAVASAAAVAGPTRVVYLRSRESRRSFRSLPSVWQVGQ